ncbi:hypothetical protein HJG54_19250 [Leptolyngbya sp. NK1-12]|uniref:Uncharacterized protein n=1 Tax=Leptolyngbya sp. NK1-12 TaxID=2547451 RepID=A0AA97AR47_9CYAN|nr:hypothetical protein [Leptolyngbya sp. NK1-12]WNZ24768.1 hypothetical protein HJG54_19250 [Leptolyngbya sp. NK1-12]
MVAQRKLPDFQNSSLGSQLDTTRYSSPFNVRLEPTATPSSLETNYASGIRPAGIDVGAAGSSDGKKGFSKNTANPKPRSEPTPAPQPSPTAASMVRRDQAIARNHAPTPPQNTPPPAPTSTPLPTPTKPETANQLEQRDVIAAVNRRSLLPDPNPRVEMNLRHGSADATEAGTPNLRGMTPNAVDGWNRSADRRRETISGLRRPIRPLEPPTSNSQQSNSWLSRSFNSVRNGISNVTDNVTNTINEAWRDTSGFLDRNYQTISNVGHTALEVAGVVPVFGAVPDLINAAWYGAEGRETEAALSLIGAVPFAGDATTVARLGARYGDDVVQGAANLLRGAQRTQDIASLPDAVNGTIQGATDAVTQFAQGDYLQAGLSLANGGLSATGIRSGVSSATSSARFPATSTRNPNRSSLTERPQPVSSAPSESGLGNRRPASSNREAPPSSSGNTNTPESATSAPLATGGSGGSGNDRVPPQVGGSGRGNSDDEPRLTGARDVVQGINNGTITSHRDLTQRLESEGWVVVRGQLPGASSVNSIWTNPTRTESVRIRPSVREGDAPYIVHGYDGPSGGVFNVLRNQLDNQQQWRAPSRRRPGELGASLPDEHLMDADGNTTRSGTTETYERSNPDVHFPLAD